MSYGWLLIGVTVKLDCSCVAKNDGWLRHKLSPRVVSRSRDGFQSTLAPASAGPAMDVVMRLTAPITPSVSNYRARYGFSSTTDVLTFTTEVAPEAMSGFDWMRRTAFD